MLKFFILWTTIEFWSDSTMALSSPTKTEGLLQKKGLITSWKFSSLKKQSPSFGLPKSSALSRPLGFDPTRLLDILVLEAPFFLCNLYNRKITQNISLKRWAGFCRTTKTRCCFIE